MKRKEKNEKGGNVQLAKIAKPNANANQTQTQSNNNSYTISWLIFIIIILSIDFKIINHLQIYFIMTLQMIVCNSSSYI